MTYYVVFVEKEDWERQVFVTESKFIQICTSEEEAINWIKGTDVKTIAALAWSLDRGLIDLYVRDVHEDEFDERSNSREFFTDEAINPFKNDNTEPYRYKVWCMKFDNKNGLSSIRHH